MLTTKTFLKKTRRGKVIKVVREHYLRDDIPCGSERCPLECKDIYEAAVAELDNDDEAKDACNKNALLPEDPKSRSGALADPHYIIIDTNIALEHIDFLEDGDGLTNVIVLQTVLAEIRHRSSPIFKRIKDILADGPRKFHFFVNEHHKDCYVERLPGESANDYNDRTIRKAAKWFSDHLKVQNIKLVLLTDDAACRKIAAAESTVTFSLKSYVESFFENVDSLMDRMSSGEEGKDELKRLKKNDELFPPHLTPQQINSGIKCGKLMQGTYFLSHSNYREATVNSDSYDAAILVSGLANQNRAVHGDTVAIELLEKRHWVAPSEVVADQDDVADGGDVLEGGEEDWKAVVDSKLQPTARVVGIIRRKWRQYCGMLLPPAEWAGSGGRQHIFVPAEKKIPKVRIETRQASSLAGKRIVVAIDAWPRHSRYPRGHFVRVLGPVGDKATENQVLLLEHDIPHSSFSSSVMDCLPEPTWAATADDRKERRDLTGSIVCSVDPPGCTDIDDALHCAVLANGNWEVGVHIADVSHFVRPNTAMDAEAANRCTTVYLTDRRIDMLPELLSSNLCSLRQGVERLAFSCVWEVDPETGEIVNTDFFKSVIKSVRSMTYEEAQNKIDDDHDEEPVAEALRRLLKLSKVLKAKRVSDGALRLASSEVRFVVDSETADPVDVQTNQVRETNSMVEEFMLAANVSAAKRIFESFPDCSMLRRHPCPPPSNFEPLVLAGRNSGFEIRIESGKELADSLDAAVDPDNPFLNTMLRMIATRCMMQALYFASGTTEEPLFAHYGLACGIYTHFTSPIRRYADVIVHRLLAVSVEADVAHPALLDKKRTQLIANNINRRHRMAQYASRASVNLHTHLLFKNEGARDEQGYILMIKQNAVQVLIPKYGLEGTLYLRDSREPFEYNASLPSQSCNGISLKLFHKITVRILLDDSNVQHEKLMLRLVDPFIDGFSLSLSSDGVKHKRKSNQKLPFQGSTSTKRIKSSKR